MFNRAKFSLRKALVLTLSGLFVSVSAQSQTIPTQTLVNAPPILLLNTKQQAVLGIHVATVQASTRTQLLANATVVTAPGKEFTVSAPYAGQISRLMVGVGDPVKSGTALALGDFQMKRSLSKKMPTPPRSVTKHCLTKE
jgi:membrane fusion protein, heavy metal efflux system